VQYDVFISHSSLDKETVARPLAEALKQRDISVWLDEEQLQIGDSIRRGIDNALQRSRFGVVILSPAYLESEWTRKELDAFFSKEKQHHKTILPIFHGLELADIEHFSPMLSDKIALTTDDNIETLADKIQHRVQTPSGTPAPIHQAKKNFMRFPNTNMQWLIASIIALAAIVIPTWISLSSKTNTPVVNVPATTIQPIRDSSIDTQGGDFKIEATGGSSVNLNMGDGQIIQKDKD